jgi:hypothetical protein
MMLARFGILGSEKPALIDAQGRLHDAEYLADITAESFSGQQLLISPGITDPDELIVGCGLIGMNSAAYHLARQTSLQKTTMERMTI